MRTPIFQVDAFTTRRFAGNPAAVMLLDRFPDDDLLQALAAENNLPATAFLVKEGGDYRIRWFTPTRELPLCGHGTFASAAVVMERLEPGRDRVIFHSPSGPLTVTRTASGYRVGFPARLARPVPAPSGLAEALGATPVEVWADLFNFLVLLESATVVRELAPDVAAVARLGSHGVIVTAPGDGNYDLISRYFTPAQGLAEDSVTGSAHCALTPFWARRLGKTELRAFQASRRGGEIVCRLAGDRVELEGACVFYLEGQAEI
jgi:PhzF family phenazine biosynthesis protein